MEFKCILCNMNDFEIKNSTIRNDILKIYKNNLDLVTTKFRSDNGKYNYIYKTFDFLQIVVHIFQ